MAVTNRTAVRKRSLPDRRVKIIIAVIFLVSLLGLSIFLALGSRTGIAFQPGFFGTKANLFSDLNLVAQILILAGLCFGYLMARRRNIPAHQYIQTGMVLMNIVLTIFIMDVAYIRLVLPQIPSTLARPFGLVSTIHAVIGAAAIVCGLFLVLRMNKLVPPRWRIKWWKQLMRITLALYLLVGFLGIILYLVWYVL